MEALRKLGEIIRNHYEKIILTIVLLGLALAVLYVYQASQSEKEKIKKSLEEITSRKPTPVRPADLTGALEALKSARSPTELAFSGPHNLVNPVKWKKKPGGEVYKLTSDVGEIGWGKMIITRRAQLRFIVAYDRPANPGYWLKLTKEAAERPPDRRPKPLYVTLNTTNKFIDRLIVLREIKGPPEKPEELGIELADAGERITVATNKAFERIEGYEVDLKNTFLATNNVFLNLRVGSPIKIASDDYIIVAINENEVVASARANDKKYTVREFAPTTTNATNRVTAPVAPQGTSAQKPPP